MALQQVTFPFHFWRMLTKDKAASTFIRLARSQHVADLQLIFWISCILMLAGSIFVITWHTWVDSSGVIGSTALISGVVGVGCGVLAWTYQTGSARLGVVDLFACEITTICRVIAIAETAPRYVQMYRDPPPRSMNFSSQEHYSPVFDQNSKDLEVLEARVVERVTEFYTYMKALRDYLRLLSTIERPHDEVERWSLGMRSVIYMLFLMLESARKSVDRLVEFEPERAQNTITILLSELVAYGLLLEVFEADARERPGYSARAERLRLRKRDYLDVAPQIYRRANDLKDNEEWQGAAALIGELNQRYYDVFGEWIDAGAARSSDPLAPRAPDHIA
jgi:hypothetical protein